MATAALAEAQAGAAGRGYVAARAVHAGELLHAEQPLALAVDPAHAASVCAWCLAPAAHRCAQCQLLRFCGRGCQRAAWPQHKPECRALAALPAARRAVAPTLLRLAAQVLWSREALAQCLARLRGHRAALSEAAKEQLAQLLFAAREYMGNIDLPPEALDLLAALVCNTFAVTDAG